MVPSVHELTSSPHPRNSGLAAGSSKKSARLFSPVDCQLKIRYSTPSPIVFSCCSLESVFTSATPNRPAIFHYGILLARVSWILSSSSLQSLAAFSEEFFPIHSINFPQVPSHLFWTHLQESLKACCGNSPLESCWLLPPACTQLPSTRKSAAQRPEKLVYIHLNLTRLILETCVGTLLHPPFPANFVASIPEVLTTVSWKRVEDILKSPCRDLWRRVAGTLWDTLWSPLKRSVKDLPETRCVTPWSSGGKLQDCVGDTAGNPYWLL